MADIFQINLPDGNTYNIKDTTKTASTGTTQGKWYKIAEGTFPGNGERLDLLFAASSGTDNVYSGIYNFTARTVNNEKYVNILVYLRDQMVYTYDTQAVYDNDTWAIYQYIRAGSIKSITWTIISETINTSANPPYTLYNDATPETSIPSSYTYQTSPGIGGRVGGVYQQNNADNFDMPILLGDDNYYVYKNSNIAVNPYTGNLQTTQLNGATIGNPPRWEGTQAQYDALTTYDPNTIYYITDGIPGGVRDINDLSDVSILSPQNGQTLTYNSTSQMWANTTLVKSDTLSDCTTDSVGMVNNYYPSMTDRVILNAVKLRTVGTSDYAYVEYMPNSTDANYILLVKTRDGAAYASQSGFSIKYWYISI